MDEIDGTQFLKDKIEAGMETLRQAFEVMRRTHETYQATKKDTTAYQLALEAHTRNSDHPYQPLDIPIVNFGAAGTFEVVVSDHSKGSEQLELIGAIEPETADNAAPEVASGSGKKMGKALDLSLDSPTGIVRNIFQIQARDKSVDAISIDFILDFNLAGATVALNRDAIYRVLPRMLERGEIQRTGRGLFRYNPEFLSTEEE